MNNETNKECWVMSSKKYYAAAAANVTEVIGKKWLRLHSKYVTPLANGYMKEIDVTPELKAYGL